MPNRLATQASPYLQQHAGNPVDWWPWCEEAFAEARRRDVPVLLSVGYSACHWCHVMAHESFEDPAIAALMNELYVCIKVDREERPDVDGIYMQAVQAMSGHGGWPMTVFLTPAGAPFFGGTYFPPADRHGMRGFPFVLRAASEAYHARRDAVERTAAQVHDLLRPPALHGGDLPTAGHLDAAARTLVEQTDLRDGGFGGAPKFPHPAALELLLRRFHATGDHAFWDAAAVTLDAMARGGIHDHLGGGFHRYSVDATWAVPHFEKMLYDTAQLVPVYLHAFQLGGRTEHLRAVTAGLDWMARDLRLPGGGFASALDADSEGREGVYYAWTPAQLEEVLCGDDAGFAAALYGVDAAGNFEDGATVLHLARTPAELDPDDERAVERAEHVRALLLAARERRTPPGRDDKVLTAWNALAIAAFAEAGAALDRHDYVAVARGCAEFLLTSLRRDGVLLRSWRDGIAGVPGFLDDHAYLCDALLTLYEAAGERRWYDAALELAAVMGARFHDAEDGFFDTAADAERLLVRPRTLDDNPVPSGRSAAAQALLRLHALSGDATWYDLAADVVRPLTAAIARAPLAVANLALAAELLTSPPREVAVAGPSDDARTRALVAAVQSRYTPGWVLAWGDPGVPMLEGRTMPGGAPAAYVCHDFACDAPVSDPAAVGAALAPQAAEEWV